MSFDLTGTLAPHTLIIGCGYCGRALSRRLTEGGQTRVWGTRRSDDGALEAAGARPLLWDLKEGSWDLPEALVGETVDLVYMVPPMRGDDPHGPMRSVLEWLQTQVAIRALVYVGATSVYGDSQGGLVKAADARQPSSARGKKRAEAEDLVLSLGHHHGWRVCLARLPGIYGPGRTVEERLREGTYNLVGGGHKWTTRVHRDDVAMGVEVLLRHGAAGAPYIVCDDEPFQVFDLIDFLCDRRGHPRPPEPSLEAHEEARGAFAASFWRTSNRYDNEAIGALPGFVLRYPSFRQGYEDIWRSEAKGDEDGL